MAITNERTFVLTTFRDLSQHGPHRLVFCCGHGCRQFACFRLFDWSVGAVTASKDKNSPGMQQHVEAPIRRAAHQLPSGQESIVFAVMG
jgi:hypothetical protein